MAGQQKRKLSSTDNRPIKYRKKHEINLIAINGSEKDISSEEFDPVQSFKELKTIYHKSSKHLIKFLTSKFEYPTPIQAQTWSVLNNKRDLIGVAETGSGKTLSFALPVIADICKKFYKLREAELKSHKLKVCSPECLVLSPTRELAIQSYNVIEELTQVKNKKFNTSFSSLVIYGGAPRFEQQGKLRLAQNLSSTTSCIIVATVGRLLDFINSNEISLSRVKYLILDEADRMLDQGFEKEVRNIISLTPMKRQTIMFSATFPPEILKIAREFMKNPIKVSIGSDELSANKKVKQTIIVVEPRSKDRNLSNILIELKENKKIKEKIIVFALYKKESSRVESYLQRLGYKAVALNGDKSQKDREEALDSFLKGKSNILVATDVASRGLDIKNVTTVINYTFPLTIEDYVHRIGRTGRAGKEGKSITFFTFHEKHLAGSLQNVLRENDQEIPDDLKKFGNSVKKKTHGMYGAHFKAVDNGVGDSKAKHIKF